MKKGFTMIELLIVIMLIGLLAAVTITSYTKTRQAAELSLLTDQLITDLREAKSKASTASSNCIGFQITETGELQNIEAQYLNPFQKCNASTIKISKKYTTKNLTISKISRENLDQPLKSLQLLFYPPQGAIYLPEIDLQGTDSNQNTDNIILELSLGSKTNDQRVLINRKNGTIQKSFK